MFLLKKVVSAFLLPLPFGLCLVALGLILHWRRKRLRLARIAIVAGIASVLLPSLGIVSSALMRPLESAYEPMLTPARTAAAGEAMAWVVVLGGGARPRERTPASTMLAPATLGRVVEGVRIWKELQGATLLLTGAGKPNVSELAGRTAEVLGVPGQAIVLERRPQDTADEARLVRERVGATAIILVTSASHMPRAAAMFRRQGLTVLPAPTDYDEGPGFALEGLQPEASSIARSEAAIHEYIGYAWAWLRGQV